MTRLLITFLFLISILTSSDAQIKITNIDRPSTLPINFYLHDKKPIEYLFSSTGDTLLWPVDKKVFVTQIKNKATVDLDSFNILPKSEKITVSDYPVDFLKKYNLVNKGSLLNPDSVSFITANFKILKHFKVSKSFWSPELNFNFYHLDLAVTIKVCNKVVLDNYKFRVEYESDQKRTDLKFNKSEVIDNLIKIDNKAQYYFTINIVESYFKASTKTEEKKSVYFANNILTCN